MRARFKKMGPHFRFPLPGKEAAILRSFLEISVLPLLEYIILYLTKKNFKRSLRFREDQSQTKGSALHAVSALNHYSDQTAIDPKSSAILSV